MLVDIDHMDKLEFLYIYPQVQQKVFTPVNIKSGFAAMGLVPFDPNRVLSPLQIRLQDQNAGAGTRLGLTIHQDHQLSLILLRHLITSHNSKYISED